MKVKEVYEGQKAFYRSNATREIDFRMAQLKKLERVLRGHEADLSRALYQDFGKSEFETYTTELSLLYQEIKILRKNMGRWSKPKRVPTDIANFPARSYILPEPLGVTLIIGPSNYPYLLSLLPAITSLAAGNTVILKPSEHPSNASQMMAQLINLHFPANYFRVVEGGVEVSKSLLQHPFDKIFFTGSSTVGKIVYRAAAEHLTPVTLELGGKSPTFVLADADIGRAAQRIVWAKFLNAGQTCIAPDYVLVERAVEGPFLEAVGNALQKYPSDPKDRSEHYLKIITTRQYDRLCRFIDRDKLYCGGQTAREERFISPTVLHPISWDDRVMQEEVFGPILPVLPFSDLGEAIDKILQRPKPLACYIYSKNRKTIRRLLKEISFGGGAVNDSLMQLSNSHLPFGGVGYSGMGKYRGKAGWDTFSHHKSILDKPFWFEPTFKYPPYSPRKRKIIKWLLK